jgi:hypothetical protein
VTPAQRERWATLLVEAVTLPGRDKAACERAGVSLRTLQRARSAVTTDAKLAELVASKKAASDANWADELPGAIRSAIEWIQRATELGAVLPDADTIHAMAGALKILTDVGTAHRVLEVRLKKMAEQQAGGNVTPIRKVGT